MLEKTLRIKLARLLKLYKQVSTNGGVLEAEAEELTPGTEVYITNPETQDLEPAKDGIYQDTTNNVEYIVEGGTIKEIHEIEPDPAVQTEEEMETESANGEDKNKETEETESANGEDENKETEETESANGEDENKDNFDEEIEALKQENEALKKENEELKAKLAEYVEKENDIPAEKAEDKEEMFSNATRKLTRMERALKLAEELNK